MQLSLATFGCTNIFLPLWLLSCVSACGYVLSNYVGFDYVLFGTYNSKEDGKATWIVIFKVAASSNLWL